jgi:hypothetical protein
MGWNRDLGREAEMRKMIVITAVLVVAFVALRRFGPALGTRAMAMCHEVMARRGGVAPSDRSDPTVTSRDPTPTAA